MLVFFAFSFVVLVSIHAPHRATSEVVPLLFFLWCILREHGRYQGLRQQNNDGVLIFDKAFFFFVFVFVLVAR